jgi:predicted dehydrogenase
MSKTVGVGIIGCGSVSGQYLRMAGKFSILRILACSDIVPEAARAKAKEFNIPRVCSPDELLADPQIDIVLNLTIPKAHAPLALATLDAGKHTYMEKPLGTSRAEAMSIMAKAREKGLLVGCAPDTFMGNGIQTARKAVDDGLIGRPTAFTAFMMCPGHESWHPNPEFHYQAGGGPMFDMGPYYLTALLNFFGPVKRLVSIASIANTDRTIGSGAKKGRKISVETPEHVTGCIEFENGAVGTMIQSFATYHGQYGSITLYGTEGTLQVPDPNNFTGTVRLRRKDDADWSDLPPIFPHEYGRSVGLADMAGTLRGGGSFRASGDQGLVVLHLIEGFLESSAQGRQFMPTIAYKRPAPMPLGQPFEVLN